jgi:membrane protease YdiL (CAAX protease family)
VRSCDAVSVLFRKLARRSGGGWLWFSLLPFGLGAWAPIVAGVRFEVRRWTALGVFWATLAALGWVLGLSEPVEGRYEPVPLLLVCVAWMGGVGTSLAIRSSYMRRMAARHADVQGMAGDGTHWDVWPWLSLLPFGLGAWAPIIAGVRCGVRRWSALGLLWGMLALAGWMIAATAPAGSEAENLAAAPVVAAWIAGIATSFVVRPAYDRRVRERTTERAAWPEPTARSRQWSIRYALAAYVVTFLGVTALAASLYFGLGVQLPVGAGVLVVDATLLFALLPLRRRGGLRRQDLGLRGAPGARSVGLVVLSLIAYTLVAGLWVAVVHPHAGAGALADVRNQSTINTVVAIVAVALSAPVVEEIFFRGLLYRSLRNRLSILPAALVAGALFGLVHITSYPLDTLPVKAAFGVIACLLYERTGSLLPGIALHSFVDASAIDIALENNDLIVITTFLALAAGLLIRTLLPTSARTDRPAQPAEIPQATQ